MTGDREAALPPAPCEGAGDECRNIKLRVTNRGLRKNRMMFSEETVGLRVEIQY